MWKGKVGHLQALKSYDSRKLLNLRNLRNLLDQERPCASQFVPSSQCLFVRRERPDKLLLKDKCVLSHFCGELWQFGIEYRFVFFQFIHTPIIVRNWASSRALFVMTCTRRLALVTCHPWDEVGWGRPQYIGWLPLFALPPASIAAWTAVFAAARGSGWSTTGGRMTLGLEPEARISKFKNVDAGQLGDSADTL